MYRPPVEDCCTVENCCTVESLEYVSLSSLLGDKFIASYIKLSMVDLSLFLVQPGSVLCLTVRPLLEILLNVHQSSLRHADRRLPINISRMLIFNGN